MRDGTYSSSNAWKLMTTGKKPGSLGAPALKYIKQVNYERRLGRAINTEVDARPTSWGKIGEKRVFNIIDTSYQYVAKHRLFHPDFKFWSGAPDFVKDSTVADAKCPHSLEVFCDKIEALQDLGTYKEEFPEDYWQHISNSILLNANGFPVTHFEAIVYVPYKKELEAIRELASSAGELGEFAKWIYYATDEHLPHLIEGGFYKNLNIIRFDVLPRDVEALTERFKECGEHLIKLP